MRHSYFLYVSWNEDYLTKSFPVLLWQWTHCLAGEILIYKSKSFTSLLTNWPLTYLSLKRQRIVKLIHRKQLSEYLQSMYKAGSCNVNSPLLSHWIHCCFPTGISPWWQMTHSSCLLSSDLTWTHHLHQILQSFPTFVMWSNFRQLNCLKRRSDDVPETSKARCFIQQDILPLLQLDCDLPILSIMLHHVCLFL